MRIVGLLVVLAIIYVVYSKRLGPDSKKQNSAMSEYEQTVNPTGNPSSAPAPAPAASGSNSNSGGSSVRRPIDTTRNVLEQVKKRNGDGQF